MQTYAATVSLLLITVIAVIFWWAVRNSASQSNGAAAAGGIEWYRGAVFWGLAALGLLVALVTLVPWPHDVTASQGDAVVVTATGTQWSWDLSPREVPANRPIIFKVTSSDVNHGFGVYDSTGAILFQTQSMPGYVNQVRYTFTRPGRYRVLCMEYCGLVHHEMIEELRVVAN